MAIYRPNTNAGSLYSLIRHWYDRGLNRAKIILKVKDSKRFRSQSVANIQSGIDYWQKAGRAARNVNQSGDKKNIDDMDYPNKGRRCDSIRVSISGSFVFPRSNENQKKGTSSIGFVFDLPKDLTKGELMDEIKTRIVDYFNTYYPSRSNRRNITNLKIDTIEGC